jgi:uncharacterized radical SAM protein YgiQ
MSANILPKATPLVRRRGRPAADALPPTTPPLPMTRAEMDARGWSEVDVVFVTGDAYIDHPSFAMALLGRLLESEGYKVAILSQPNWKSVDDWRRFGKPRLFFAVSGGNMDSMINHYTANRKVRNDDAYSPNGEIGKRPDRCTLAYCQRAREAYKGVPVIAGGVEASLRRIAHYDFWSDAVRKPILFDCKADLLVYGMGERGIVDIADRLARGETIRHLHDMRGLAFSLGASSKPPPEGDKYAHLPSFEEVKADDIAFCTMTRVSHRETNPYNAKGLVQRCGTSHVVVNPPALPLEQREMDYVYDLPYTGKPHPSYGNAKIPAFEVIKDSVQIMRGCFGGCTFCSITAHEGRVIQSRSKDSVLREIRKKTQDPDFKGVISDIGGPTANMYEMRCTKPEVEKICRRLSCVHPTVCKLLGTSHGPLKELMKESREIPGVKQVFVASGIRMDLARKDPEYMSELVKHHVGGYLKVAPEHTHAGVLDMMKKPANDDFEKFDEAFHKASRDAGKDQYLIPYFIASHPGSDIHAMIDLALFLKRNNYKPDQVQDFIPSPFDVAACMFHTGYDPMTMKKTYVAKHLRDRKLQRALMQYFKPENWFEVNRALKQAGRAELIGDGCDCLIPGSPPRAALDRKRRQANRALTEHSEGDHIRGKPQRPRSGGGYRPHRKSATRRSPKK